MKRGYNNNSLKNNRSVGKLAHEKDLIRAVQSGVKNAFDDIAEQYKPLVVSSINGLMSEGCFTESDFEDLNQEASIALYNAVMSFDLTQDEVTFGLYAKICLRNSLASVLRRRKRQLAADDAQSSEGECSTHLGETDDYILEHIKRILSPFEFRVFRLLLPGYSHKYIADSLGKPVKSIDNAVCRIRKKLSWISGAAN